MDEWFSYAIEYSLLVLLKLVWFLVEYHTEEGTEDLGENLKIFLERKKGGW